MTFPSHSPSKKIPGASREQYLRKQGELLASDTNLVEVDLIRQGVHTLAFPLEIIKPQYRTASLVCVRRATQRIRAEVYRLPLEQRLPVIKIPLRSSDADVSLDLQALIEQCYRNGGYRDTLNYAADAEPAQRGTEAEWADELLREKSLREKKKPPRRKGKPKAG